ncbi:hypothetical protein [Fimbriiglobus ruber]|uniref:Uncharacterized protein n=1 Tax=Fimbriiglobus ruber TaxID=1908690 RepID=A0A225DRM7_9BACT|nr:hypothetical protein [Fimbriiglobus ruber]OWK43753.1 hypothetical protein FRUB_03352 [Fimbriiglobus ruber]
MPVYWLIAASENLRAAVYGDTIHDPKAFTALRTRIDGVLAKVFPGQVVIVRDRLSGYRPFDGLAILLVEVQPDATSVPVPSGLFPSPGTFIVKVAFDGMAGELHSELRAWDTSRPAHLRSDSVFVSLDPYPSRESGRPPEALVYGDASAVLGQKNPLSLEDAVIRACRFGQPRPESIGRLLRTLYERLETHFYPCSVPVPPTEYLAPTARPRLTDLLLPWREPSGSDRFAAAPPIKSGSHDEDLRQIRRETLALLADDHAAFADPFDFLTGAWEVPGLAPVVLRGFSHGDLHGRNVQVAVVADDADHCAVFDYEKMRGTTSWRGTSSKWKSSWPSGCSRLRAPRPCRRSSARRSRSGSAWPPGSTSSTGTRPSTRATRTPACFPHWTPSWPRG